MTKKGRCFFLVIIAASVFFGNNCYAGADLDGVYGPLVPEGSLLYKGNTHYYQMSDKGTNGRSDYEDNDASPYYVSFDNSISFSPVSSFEITAGEVETLPTSYTRYSYEPNRNLKSVQQFEIDFFRDYYGGTRIRLSDVELCFNILERRQKTGSDATIAYPSANSLFSHVHSNYEEISLSLRYVTFDEKNENDDDEISTILGPLLNTGQWSFEVGSEYINGEIDKEILFTSVYYKYSHGLGEHFIPFAKIGLGITDNVDFLTGIRYATPYKYEYRYNQYSNGVIADEVKGTYGRENDFQIPLRLRCRPLENIEIGISSDSRIAEQQLDYSRQLSSGAINNYPRKNLVYYNMKPRIAIGYFHRAGRSKAEEGSRKITTKPKLRAKQWSVSLSAEKDITWMDKSQYNGSQNFIDPYNIFKYPLDNYTSGTEYSLFLLGNSTTYSAGVQPQNYYLFDINLAVGITDRISIGLGAGYRTESSFDSFSLNDMKQEWFKIKPYCLFNGNINFVIGETTELSFNGHYVPEYKTIAGRQDDPDEFRSTTSYTAMDLTLKQQF
ncbi:MAG: hypothetical protein HQL29_02940 [Candidatus Omnitrophica bacterium]|nr:hypothetical protein [Candidatus Omnitrophota bacterium]